MPARKLQQSVVSVVGLGYVGLPLAVAFGRHLDTIGYDIDDVRLGHYREGNDPTGSVSVDDLRAARKLRYTSDVRELSSADIIVVALPTPVDQARQPDFGPLSNACRTIAPIMKRGVTLIFESTVYPGATEEVCVPLLERHSSLVWKQDFHVGYSPERINPGDREHTLATIVKVVAGDTPETLDLVASLYSTVVLAGVHRVSSIKVAEAAKVIENTQRDLNIALMNELAMVFNRIGIDTVEVLEAAGTKWNFLPFRPGLVGGHCIGVDPYYLTHKAERLGYNPQVILAGRRINDGMGKFIAEQTVKQLIQAGHAIKGSVASVLGLTFKEDVPDVRNTRVVDVVRELESYGMIVHVCDPVADAGHTRHEYGIDLVAWDRLPPAHALVAAVPHREFMRRDSGQIVRLMVKNGCFIDVKARFDANALRRAGINVWRL
ncbi:MAG: nucleotide sugar dehydrogenase [Pseudomonadota bacterium]